MPVISSARIMNGRYPAPDFGLRVGAGILAFILLALFASPSIAQPPKGYDVISYHATLLLNPATDSISGEITLDAKVEDDTEMIDRVLQYAKYLTIDSVFVNGARATFAFDDTSIGEYYVFAHIDRGSHFAVQTYYHGKGTPEQDASAWGGVSDEDSIMFAMGVGFQAPYTSCTRHWLPCYDLPDDKADSVDLTFITPARDVTASNGRLISNTLTPGGTRVMHWHEGYPIATYLLTFAAGPLTLQKIPNSLHIPFEVYALASDSIAASTEMRVRVAPTLAFYDSLFGPYPFEKAGYVITPIGSMEHQTMISLDKHTLVGDSISMGTDTTGISTTAVHELSHQWWGDRVTCNTFSDAWLNEGFAEYCESLALEHLFGHEHYLSRQHFNIASAKSVAYYPLFGAASYDHHTNNYPSAIYTKGASVLGMLRQYLGDSVFFSAVRYYGNSHAYRTVTSYDLWNDFDTVSGQDLGWFFKPWVFGTGYPKDTIVWSKTANGANITFHQAKNTATTPYFRMPIPVLGKSTRGASKIVTVWMDSTAISSGNADFGFIPDTLIFDPEQLLLMRIVRVTEAPEGVPFPTNGHTTGALNLRAFPNPDANGILEISIDASQTKRMVSLMLSDLKGHIVRHIEEPMVDQHFDTDLSLIGLSKGDYILSAQSGAEKAIQKISFVN